MLDLVDPRANVGAFVTLLSRSLAPGIMLGFALVATVVGYTIRPFVDLLSDQQDAALSQSPNRV